MLRAERRFQPGDARLHRRELRRLHGEDGAGRGRDGVVLQADRIPVVGVVTAGVPILATENIEGYIPWDGESGCFVLRVRGDSMIGAGILDGDKVVVRPQPDAENGQIVVALLDDSATVKRLKKTGRDVWLMPENPSYEPIPGNEAKILGRVKALIREY